MSEIDNDCTFDIGPDQIEFHTKTNGDLILIRGFHLEPNQAATLAYFVNSPNITIEIQIKEKS